MIRRRETNVFSIAFLDLLSGALGAVIILYIAVPKNKIIDETKAPPVPVVEKELYSRLKKDYQENKRELQDLKIKLSEMSKKALDLQADNTQLYDDMNRAKAKALKVSQDAKPGSGIPVDVGFKFKGKNIVFIIDVSGSMYKEGRISQVKAGLKMLITSMPKEFKIDVVQYPNRKASSHLSLWGHLKSISQSNKIAIYSFLHELRPYGATPTREVLRYVLDTYKDTTDIVLLSDGAPTRTGRSGYDDIWDILSEMRGRNGNRKVQINTIGVGSDFIRPSDNDKYVFLKTLAAEHGGFFVAF